MKAISDKLQATIHERMTHASDVYLGQSSKSLGERPNIVIHKN